MQQELTINLKGNMKVDADIRGFKVSTDQPKHQNGDNTAPTPLEIFFASLGTCAGVNVADFCIERKISYKDIEIRMVIDRDDKTHAVQRINLNIRVPPDFPPKYKGALLKVVDACAVKKTIKSQPEIVAAVIDGCKI